jgi:hypothetical protein
MKLRVLSRQEVATTLWALAGLRHKPVRLLRALAARTEASVEYFNAADLAQAVWSFASLRFHPGSVLDDLALAAKAKIAGFEPKVTQRYFIAYFFSLLPWSLLLLL